VCVCVCVCVCVGHVGNFVQVELLFIIFSDVSWVGGNGRCAMP